jgi:hypothetical protein
MSNTGMRMPISVPVQVMILRQKQYFGGKNYLS